MKKIINSRLGAATLAASAALLLAACGGGGYLLAEGSQLKAVERQQAESNYAIERIQQTEHLPTLYDSSDAHNQKLFYTIQSDPYKIEYLTLIGLDGKPYAHFTIRGQVSSMNTQESNPVQPYCTKGEAGSNGIAIACIPLGLAEPNGVYQGNDNGHFAFTTSGAMIEWEGNFIESDEPFTIKNPVSLSINESVAPTSTNLTHQSGGELPKRG